MIYGYAGKILRVDLTKGSISQEPLAEATLKKYIGGTSLGAKFLYDEVAPGTEWSSPENRLFIGSAMFWRKELCERPNMSGVRRQI
ncbi:aldehyde ferredoxin oxidoreductase N-terminal domain-containing protein [Chloroflexota bacterium]